MKALIVRIILTCALLYGVYTETGIWTTLTLGLVFISSEIQGYILQRSGIA
jgi:hypothetical protein